MNDLYHKNFEKDAHGQELAQYIADMLIEMRNMAKAAGFKTLWGLLEISFCEAFSIANKVEIPPGEIEKLNRLALEGKAQSRKLPVSGKQGA
jgi:hypothetical protein